MDFTNTTLVQITKKAKKIKKENEELTLFKAKDIVSQSYGYKSYNDLKKNYDIWEKDEEIIISLQNSIGKIKYKLENSNDYIYKDLVPEDLNRVTKTGLKLMSYEESMPYFRKIDSVYYQKIEMMKFYKFTSKRINLKKLKEDFFKSEEYKLYQKFNLNYDYFENTLYIVDEYLNDIKLFDDSVEEIITLNRLFCFVKNKVFDFRDIDEEPIYDNFSISDDY